MVDSRVSWQQGILVRGPDGKLIRIPKRDPVQVRKKLRKVI
jgi:hypothetical protein